MAYAGGLLARRKVIHVLNETDKGVAETTGLVALFCLDPKIESAAEFIEREGAGKYLGFNELGIFGDEVGVFTGRVEFRGNGTDAMEAGISALLQSSGFLNTAEAYSPFLTVAAQKTCTIEYHDDGLLKILSGAVAQSLTISGEQGKPVYGDFTMLGKYAAVTDEALPAYAPDDEPPPLMGSGSFSYAADSGVLISKFSVDMGLVTTLRSGSANLHYVITNRKPVISMDPEQDLVANLDLDGFRTGRTTKDFSLVIGAAAGKKITFNAPAVQTRSLADGEREGLLIYDLTGQCNISAGNDEFTITVLTA